MQELAEHVPKGHIPRTMTVHFRGELDHKKGRFCQFHRVAPADVVELSGIFLPIPYTGFSVMRAGVVADTYLEAMSVTRYKKKYEEYELRGDEEEQIRSLADDGDIYNKLARSLAPEIYGHEDLKKALLLLLVCAPHRKLKDGMKIVQQYMKLWSRKLSIAKAGITTSLNARTAVLAAANPAWGRYDLRRTPAENINLPPALLSRFDLLWLILDRADMDSDLEMARHIVYVHQNKESPALGFTPLEPSVLRAYISAARRLSPFCPSGT
ncbi:hypothetical protein ACLB2K_046409 [Fragaria x ananassa]